MFGLVVISLGETSCDSSLWRKRSRKEEDQSLTGSPSPMSTLGDWREDSLVRVWRVLSSHLTPTTPPGTCTQLCHCASTPSRIATTLLCSYYIIFVLYWIFVHSMIIVHHSLLCPAISALPVSAHHYLH